MDYNKLRRSDREILEFSQILEVLRRTYVIRLGLNGDPYPYVVPLSFGFEELDGGADGADDGNSAGKVAVYVHGAAKGLKHDLIARDNRVCVEADIFHGIVKRGEGAESSITAEYESIVGFGTAEIVTGAQAEKGMALMLEHSGYPDFEYDKTTLEAIRMYKLTLTKIKGKRNKK